MFSFHKPKVYRSSTGCCICRAKSSSSRFTDSKKYEEDFVECFQLHERRTGEICNACVLLVKRWKKLPAGSERNWRHVVDARAGPGTKSLTKFKSKNKKKPKLKAEAIPVASSVGCKGSGSLINLGASSVSMTSEKSKKKHMYMKPHGQRNSGVSSSLCKTVLAAGNIPSSDRQRNRYGMVRDSSPSALSDVGGEEDFLSDHSPSPSPSEVVGLVDTRRKNHHIKPKLRAGSSSKQPRIRRGVVRHEMMNGDDDEEEEEPEEEEEEEEEEDEEEELYEEITRRKRSQRGYPVPLHHQRSNRHRSPVQRQQGDRKRNPSRRSQVAVSPQISSFLDMTFWKREEVCCGIIFKGPNEEVIVDPRFLKPCIGCRKPLLMEGSNSISSAPLVSPATDSAPLQSPPPALYPPNPSRGASATSSQNGGPPSNGGNKQSSTKSFSDSSSDSGYDESSNPGADGSGLNANRRPSTGVIVSAGEVGSRNVVGADLGDVSYSPTIKVAPPLNFIPNGRPSPGEGTIPNND